MFKDIIPIVVVYVAGFAMLVHFCFTYFEADMTFNINTHGRMLHLSKQDINFAIPTVSYTLCKYV